MTHSHSEGIAGAIAVAVATAWACGQTEQSQPDPNHMFEVVLDLTPAGVTRQGIEQAESLPFDEWEYAAANFLGNGSRITVQDTVPFCLWCAAAHLNSLPEALWATVNVRGDMDTNCAIVGGIVAGAVGPAGIPRDWQRSREGLHFRSQPSIDA